MERPDLILGVADGYRWDHVRNFVESLRASGYAGEVVFFGRIDPETRARLVAVGVEVVRPRLIRVNVRGTEWRPYNPKTTRLRWHLQPLLRPVVRALSRLSRDPAVTRRDLIAALSNIEVARFFWYRQLLAERRGRYRNVMVTDVRDVLFLGDPFGFDLAGTVSYFLEEDGRTLSSQTNNRGWLIGAYGQSVYETLRDRPISCSGVTIGTADGVLAYAEAMVAELVELSRQFRGMDQGVHNYVVHTGRAAGRLVANSEGPVLTLGIMSDTDAEELLARRTEEARVVHQYDRHPALLDILGLR
jgi:hypothetical protein